MSVALAIVLGSCGDGAPLLFSVPSELTVLSAPQQSGTVRESVDDPPRVQVLDARGNPATGTRVRFRVERGNGTIERTEALADERGLAAPGDWRLGELVGENRITASAGAVESVTFQADAGPAAPDTMVRQAGNGAVGTVGQSMQFLPVVTVRDRFGNPVPSVPIRFVVVEGEGVLEGAEVVSDENGRGGPTAWVLGTTAGVQSVEARVEGISPLRFDASAQPGPAHAVEVDPFEPPPATVGDTLGPITLRVQDEFGNPVNGARVEAWSPAGGGTVLPAEPRTDGSGHASLQWVLGPTAGDQRLELSVPPSQARATFEADAAPGPPNRLVALEGDGQIAAAGESVATPPAVRLTDAYANPLEGFTVTFQVMEGGGTIDGSPAVTDAHGVGRLDSWTLGDEGPQRVEARHGDLAPAVFAASTDADSRTLEAIQGGEEQEGPAGFAVEIPPAVRLVSGMGEPVEGVTVTFTVIEGGGSVTPSQVVTDGDGIANADEWVLGPEPGWNRVRASADDAQPVTFSARAVTGLQVVVEEVHLNQGSQTFPATIPLLAARDGLLRVFLRANFSNGETPGLRVDLFHGGTQVETIVLSAPGSGVPTEPDPDAKQASWSVALPATMVTPDLGVRVVVDEEGSMEVVDRSELEWPEDGSIHQFDVRQTPTFRATFVRIHSTNLDDTADLDDGNLDAYMTDTRDLLPIAESNALIRPGTYVTDAAPLTGSSQSEGWQQVAQEIRLLRLEDGNADPSALERYYHGILPATGSSGIAGMAYIADDPESNDLAAVSHDAPSTRSWVVSHEFGHNFGRLHAPCGVASSDPFLDTAFPHSGAAIGATGYSKATGELVSTSEPYRDVMSYCRPAWSSDYTWAAVLEMRQARPIGSPPALVAMADGEGLLFWGGWSRERGAWMEPAIPSHGRESRSPSGDARLVGHGASGAILFEREVSGLRVDHAEDPTLRHFLVRVVLSEEDRAELARVVLSTPEGEAQLDSPEGPGGGEGAAGMPAPSGLEVDPAPSPGAAAAAGPAWVRVRWNAAAYPVAVLRDAESGRILAIGRSGEISIPSPPSGILGADLAAGLRSLREEVPLSR